MTTTRPLHRLTEDQARFLQTALPTWVAAVEIVSPEVELAAMLSGVAASLEASLEAHRNLREMVVAASDLQSGDYIVGDAGGLVRITGEVEASSTMSGCMLVEIEVGTIYLDEDERVTILRFIDEADDERCRAEGCEDDLGDLEGYNGFCGNHADLISAHQEGTHRRSEEGPQSGCPACQGENVD